MIFLVTIDIFFAVALLVAFAVAFFQLGRGFEIGKQRAAAAARNEDLIRKLG